MANILIIEDYRDTREVTEYILREAGHEVTSVTDGLLGMTMAQRHQPDLILMDLALPYLDGWTERVNSFETDLNRQLQYELFRFRQRTHTAESCRQAAGRQGAAFAAETLDPDPLSASIAGVAAFGTKTVLEGGLIQAASGTFGALGCPPTKRSGWAA
jgi:CheY-like chemotaxis protein